MARVLIVYGTKHRQTEKIAGVIALELGKLGHTTDIFDSRDIPESVHPRDYDAVVIGAGVYAGGYPWTLRAWVRNFAEELAAVPSAFFSVCLGILQNDADVQEQERAIAKRFFDWSGWTPGEWTIFAGAISYSQYNWLLKRLMRRIARAAGAETRMSDDVEYTNWEKVRSFAEGFAQGRLRQDNPPAEARK